MVLAREDAYTVYGPTRLMCWHQMLAVFCSTVNEFGLRKGPQNRRFQVVCQTTPWHMRFLLMLPKSNPS